MSGDVIFAIVLFIGGLIGTFFSAAIGQTQAKLWAIGLSTLLIGGAIGFLLGGFSKSETDVVIRETVLITTTPLLPDKVIVTRLVDTHQPTEVTRMVTSQPIIETVLVEVPATVEVPVTVEVLVTPLPSATPTPPDNTPPETILEKGQTWKQDGAELTLKDVGINQRDVTFLFSFKNNKPNAISIEYNNETFSIVDNRGREYGTCRFFNGCWSGGGGARLAPGETFLMEPSAGGAFGIDVNTADIELKSLIITVSGVSTIEEARWIIPIQH